LQDISAKFERLAAQMSNLVTAVEQQEQSLRSNGWSGLTADRLNAELSNLVIPTLHHLQRSIQNWSQQTGKMSANVERVSAVLEDIGSRVKNLEDVQQLVDTEAIEREVRQRMQEQEKREDDHQ
jgi:hypothetical protein